MPRKAALRVTGGTVDEPNLVLPLASSYNERGILGYTHSVTNSEDQRKVNCFYELAKNAMTGKGTLTLAKRPGVLTDDALSAESNAYGSSAQLSYLVLDFEPTSLLTTPDTRTVFNVLTGNVRSSTRSFNVTILASSVFLPAYVDSTSISNVRNAVVQLFRYDSEVAHRVFFVTAADLQAGNAWTEIVDADFTGLIHRGKMEHLDGYAFIMDRNNVIWNSDLNSLANWTATSFLTKSIQQDIAVGLARLGTKLLGFSAGSVEVFYNAGNTTGSPLGRIPHLSKKIGLVPTVRLQTTLGLAGGTHYYATLEDKIYFVGRNSGTAAFSSVITASVGFYQFDGNDFAKVSSPYIDKVLSEKSMSIYSVNTIGFMGQSAIAICLTAPSATTQRSLIFFPAWKEWFEWTSTIFSPVNDRGYHIGISRPDKLYAFFSNDNWQDSATSYQWFVQFRLPTNGASRKFMPMYGVDADTDTSANDLTVEISIDDSKTFSTLGTIDQTQDRKLLFRGGSFRKAHIRLGNTNARPTRIHNLLARIE